MDEVDLAMLINTRIYRIVLLALLASPLPFYGQSPTYLTGKNTWNADSLGNHRAVITVSAPGAAAKAVINWRLRKNPAGHELIVVDAKSNRRIANVQTENVSDEQGTVYFEPVSGPGKYYVYYLPYQLTASANYPKAVYPAFTLTASNNWLQQLAGAKNAKVDYLESVDAFNSFYPMEVIATAQETKQLLEKNAGKSYLVFPEDRIHPIKMTDHLPLRWIQKGAGIHLTDTADKGENFSYQLGVLALHNLGNVQVQFSDLTDSKGNRIAAGAMSCLNTTGTNWNMQPVTNTITINSGRVQPLWCLINIPGTTVASVYKGIVTITAGNEPATQVQITLKVNNHTALHNGVNEPWKQTRLTWLNSTLAQDNEVIAPYTPLQQNGNAINLLGRQIKVFKTGFPEQVTTYFTPEMTGIDTTPHRIFYEALHFHIISAATHKDIAFKSEGVTYTTQQPGTIEWKAVNTADALQMDVAGHLEFDGAMAFTVKLTALKNADLDDIKLHLPFNKEYATYMIGLGNKGGYRPDSVSWKWDVANKNQDGAWIGSVNAGVQYSLRDEHYSRPLNTNFYLQKPLVSPSSWDNNGKGGIWVGLKGKSILSENYSGPRSMQQGDVLYFNFTLLATPFHTIDTDKQWETRFYHKYNNLDTIKTTGASVINIHHGTPVNPYINYPFVAWKDMKDYIEVAHRKGLKVKIYNTVRELSNRAYETYAMRSLGHEIYASGKGGGYSWLQEHLDSDYIAAWYVPEFKDAAIINTGMSRLHNYYVEGMNWLVNNVGIDGIYLDDVAFDRVTMKRIKRVLTQNGHPGIIDLHSANQYNKRDGFNNSANLYMEHFPYLNRLWFGEYFDYENNTPDFFLTEVSGIPFGLMGEMLEKGGNPWRGMLYGMTNRMPWSDNADPRPIWKAWDNFGMKGSKMIGYWVNDNPVTTDNANVPVTIYKKDKAVMVALASWAAADTAVHLHINWKALGIDAAKATITAPAIPNFQSDSKFNATDAIPVPKNKGLLLIIK